MEERVEEALHKYDLEVQRTYRMRGAYVLETQQGIFLYKSYRGSEVRAGYEAGIQEALISRGFSGVDQYKRSLDGSYLTYDVMGEAHVVKRWYLGEEGNLREPGDLILAAGTLAKLHLVMIGLRDDLEFEVKPHYVSAQETKSRHLRELQRIRSYVRTKKERNLFEVKFLQEIDPVMAQAEEALSFLQESSIGSLEKKSEERGDFVHGNYSYHNLIHQKDGAAVVQFEKSWQGLPLTDLYYLLRKALEKNEWDIRVGDSILESYQKERGLSREERQALYALLWFPEKFWKVANSYFNSRKSKIPGRNLVKLEEFIRQREGREEFLKEAERSLFS